MDGMVGALPQTGVVALTSFAISTNCAAAGDSRPLRQTTWYSSVGARPRGGLDTAPAPGMSATHCGSRVTPGPALTRAAIVFNSVASWITRGTRPARRASRLDPGKVLTQG
jgi:hypothetical protein